MPSIKESTNKNNLPNDSTKFISVSNFEESGLDSESDTESEFYKETGFDSELDAESNDGDAESNDGDAESNDGIESNVDAESNVYEESNGDTETDTVKSFPDSDSSADDYNSESGEINYPGELAIDISTYINDLDTSITKITVHMCVFNRDKEHKFVKYIVKIDNEFASFPTFDQDTHLNNDKDSDEEHGGLDTEKINTIKTAMGPNIEYRGFIPYEKDLFAFFEIEDDEYSLDKPYFKCVVDELDFLKMVNGVPVSETVSAFFDNNSDLRYYDEKQVSPPHSGTLIPDMGLFGRGKYFEINGKGDTRYAFFTQNVVYLLGDDMIEAFQKRPDEQKIIDYDGIFFRKDGKDHWFIPDIDAVFPI